MSWTRRRLQVLTAGVVVAAWTVVYFGVITYAPLGDPAVEGAARMNRETALLLAVPTAVYVGAALLVLHFWLAGAGARLAALDPPGRVLATAVATLPAHRRDWGAAMTGELAGVRGRSARWWFALSCAQAALRLPPRGGWLALATVTGAVMAATVAAGPAVGAAVPGLEVFAASFVALAGALVVLAVARSSRVRLRVPAPTILVVAGVAAAIAMAVVLLLREPSVAAHLPPARAVFLAAVLAGCLWVAVASLRSLGTSRLAPHLGAGAALVYVAGRVLAGRIATDQDLGPRIQELGVALFVLLLFLGPALIFCLPALWAGLADRSFRSGVRAGAWTAIALLPLAFASSLHESLRIYASGGGVGFDHLSGPVGVILEDAVFWSLVFVPVVGAPCAVFGAAVGAFLRPARPGGTVRP